MIEAAIDRVNGPDVMEMAPLDFPVFELRHLENGIKTYIFKDNTVEAIQLLIEIYGGRMAEKYRGIASAVATNFVNGFKMSDGTDAKAYLLHRGAEVEAQTHGESILVRVLCLRRHWDDVLMIVRLLLTSHFYPQAELDIYLSKQKNRYEVNMLKTDYRAQRAFNAAVFGENHALGYASNPTHYDKITPGNLVDFARNNFVPGNMQLYLAGYVDESILSTVNKYLGDANWTGKPFAELMPPFNGLTEKKHLEKIPQTVQASIMMGKLLPAYKHQDTPPLTFASTMLGGYFGARLMQNLREEHGYTYGVHLSTSMNSAAGCLYISTDVGRDVTLAAIEQIKLELKKAGETLCEEDEVLTVRNVLMGKALKRIDGVFNAQYTLRFLHNNHADETYFKTELEQFYALNPEIIKQIAIQYLNPDSFYLIVAGDVDI